MSDFVPEDMLTIELGTREEISLHEFADSKRGMQYIRGAYFVNAGQSTENKQLIDFFVLDPNYQVIYSRRGKDEGIFRFNTTMPGQYSFVFSNMNDKHVRKSVTVALHPGYDVSAEEEEKAKKEVSEMAKAAGVDELEIKTLNNAVKDMTKKIKNLFTEAKMSMIR